MSAPRHVGHRTDASRRADAAHQRAAPPPSTTVVVGYAAAAAIGAMAALPVPRWPAVALVVVAVAWRRPWLLVVGLALLTSALAVAARDGLHRSLPARVDGEVTLVSDPVPVGMGEGVEVRHEGVRYRATAYGAVGAQLARSLAGERITVRASVRSRPERSAWFDQRHLAGSLQIEQITGRRDAAPVGRAANALRRVVERGAAPLGRAQRALYTGLVYGDDREQTPILVDDFRASGLGHLLAVSGQNVAFALAVASPVLSRTSYRLRTPLTVLVLAGFATATRFEPSVLRATAMAALAALAAHRGRRVHGLHVLSLAVVVVLVADPLLVGAVGFQLSVLASAGIIVLAPPLASRLPGPRPLATALATTIAAQLAVAPLQAGTFGGVPPVALFANLLAVPIAGPLMVWGLTGGVVAGLVPPLAPMLQLPTRVGLWWIAAVAHAGGRAPLGELTVLHLAALAVPVGALALLSRHRATQAALVPARDGPGIVWPALGGARTPTRAPGRGGVPRSRRASDAVRVALVVAACAVVAAPGVAAWRGPAGVLEVDGGVELWRGAGMGAGRGVVVVLDGDAAAADVLGALRRAGVRRIDLVVARRGSRREGEVVAALAARWRLGAVWAPAGHQVRRARVAPVGSWHVPGLDITVGAVSPRVDVTVTVAPSGPTEQPLASPP